MVSLFLSCTAKMTKYIIINMSYFGNKQEGEKILRGAYTYSRNKNIYSEEQFELYREKKTLSYCFYSEMLSRVATGELLTIRVKYRFNNDYIPLLVDISRSLGGQDVSEKYTFDPKLTLINYTFTNEDGQETASISTNPKFYITSPSTASSMLSLRSKKVDASGKNFYTFLTSKNMWEYKEEPSFKSIVMQRHAATTENLKLDDKNLQATRYKLSEGVNDDDEGGASTDSLKIWISQHMTVPYLIEATDGTRIQIKYLNNLERD